VRSPQAAQQPGTASRKPSNRPDESGEPALRYWPNADG